MNLLFIGRFYPKGILNHIIEDTRGKVGFSNHNFEMSLIGGFSKQENVDLKVLSAPMVFSYPHNNRNAFIKACRYEEKGYEVRSIGFCNIAGINMVSERIALQKAIRQEILGFEGPDVNIIVNTPSLVVSSALFKAIGNIHDKNITTTLIIPDVPECMVEMSGKISLKNRIVKKFNRRNAGLSQRFDKYVYLTEAMNDYYHAVSDDYIVMEGLIDESKIKADYIAPDYSSNKEVILYTGTLRRIFGVMELIEAFKRTELPDAELWICGSGECTSEIKLIAEADPSIKFYGFVSAEKALELQSKATILANPRSSEGEYTKYSFPSKTIEYLLAGRSVIMNRLPGVPAEYDEFLYYPEDESIDAWVDKLRSIVNEDKEARLNKSRAAREFILNGKTASIQCSRIIDLIKG